MKRLFPISCAVILLVGCSDMTSPRFDDLPQAVQNKVESQADPGQIGRIEKEKDAGRIVYHIDFRQKGKPVRIAITENGTIVNDSRNRVMNEAAGASLGFSRMSAQREFSELPVAVQRAIGARSGRLEIRSVSEVKRGGNRVYEIEFDTSGRNPKAYVTPDGVVIEDQRDLLKP